MLLITLNENTLSLSPGSQVIFPHQTWEDYERFDYLENAGRSGIRTRYLFLY